MVGASGGVRTSKERVTAVAAAKVELPAPDAVRVQVPGATRSTVRPVTVQTSGVDDAKVGATLEVAVGATVKSAAVEIWLAMAGKEIEFDLSGTGALTNLCSTFDRRIILVHSLPLFGTV
jgi:hypothetical protein